MEIRQTYTQITESSIGEFLESGCCIGLNRDFYPHSASATLSTSSSLSENFVLLGWKLQRKKEHHKDEGEQQLMQEKELIAFYAPDFYLKSSTAWFLPEFWCVLPLSEFVALLDEFRRRDCGSEQVSEFPLQPFTSPVQAEFREYFQNIQRKIKNQEIRKFVPVVFAKGRYCSGAVGDKPWMSTTPVQLLSWLIALGHKAIQADGAVQIYGLWGEDTQVSAAHRTCANVEADSDNDIGNDAGNDVAGNEVCDEAQVVGAGIVGLTPETLFSVSSAGVFKSMALAGTRRFECGEEQARAFIQDSKEKYEHELVVEDIVRQLRSLGGKLEISECQVLNLKGFGLSHLLTTFQMVDVAARYKQFEKWIRLLHPTPALGVCPRQMCLDWMQQLESNCNLQGLSKGASSALQRARFGAPFGVVVNSPSKSYWYRQALVAIRNIQWDVLHTKHKTYEFNFLVGSGCGVVEESDEAAEWAELAAKRKSIMNILNLTETTAEDAVMLPLSTVRKNRLCSLLLLKLFIHYGVTDFIYCAGARNSPLLYALDDLQKSLTSEDKDKNEDKNKNVRPINTYSMFDERSASFFALGRARSQSQPTVVITTSGTAVTELVSATAEAYHVGAGIILLTADRPRRLRGTGAPQTIVQTGVLQNFVEVEIDLEADETITEIKELTSKFHSWSRKAPLHFNICFDDPLVERTCSSSMQSDEVKKIEATLYEDLQWIEEQLKCCIQENLQRSACSAPSLMPSPSPSPLSSQSSTSPPAVLQFGVEQEGLANFFCSVKSPLIIVSNLSGSDNCHEREQVLQFLKQVKLPVLLEATSGLRGAPELQAFEVRFAEKLFSRWVRDGHIDSVLRIGGIPTTSIWRDLERGGYHKSVKVLSLSQLPFSGLSWGQYIHCRGFEFLNRPQYFTARSQNNNIYNLNNIEKNKLHDLISQEPNSEPAVMAELATQIEERELDLSSQFVYIGNSLPIRQWDLVAPGKYPLWVKANRGVNGIDGQISTFLGWAPQNSKNEVAFVDEAWGIFGDLTTLYDLNGLWCWKEVQQLRARRLRQMYKIPQAEGQYVDEQRLPWLRLVVINNAGGKIFSRIFTKANFENTHQLDFRSWAQMWDFQYVKIEERSDSTLQEQLRRFMSKTTSQTTSQSTTQSISKVSSMSASLATEPPLNMEADIVIEICPELSSTDRFWDRWSY